MLGRVVIEDCLRRLSREEGLDDKVKASVMNQNLRKADRYGQFLWRRIDALLDIGNAAAHGEFGKYTQDDVEAMLVEIERFLANELRY